MSFFPQRQFNGVPGEPSADTGGPDIIERDLDEINKMFNPGTTHTGGSQGGISKENLNFTVTNDYDNTEKSKVSASYTHATTNNANPHNTKASQVDNTGISGVVGTNVQSTMEGLKSVIDTKETIENVALKESIADANLLIKTVSFNPANGTFTFTTQGGTAISIDTNLEKVPGSMGLVEDPVGSGTYYLVIYDTSTPPVELSRCPVSTLFNPIDTIDTSTVALYLSTPGQGGRRLLRANVQQHSIGSNHLESGLYSDIQGFKTAAETAANNASASATNAGTYASNASASATSAATSAASAEGFKDEAEEAADDAVHTAFDVSQDAMRAEDARDLARSWARGGTGKRTGEDTNNAKYYCEQAALHNGDMYKTTYDPTTGGTATPVAAAGGIPAYVETVKQAIEAEIPTELADLTGDATHRVVTDTEKSTWNAKYDKPASGIPNSDIASASAWNDKYDKPENGIPDSDIASASTWNNKYDLPSGGIPDSDIASASTWNAKYNKPSGGIPDSDIASASTWNSKQNAIGSNTDLTVKTLTGGLAYVTTAPTSANTNGIKIAVLSSEPATKYSGWLYLITE